MDESTNSLPELPNSDGVHTLFERHRDASIEAVIQAGGDSGDGAAFFRAALLQTLMLRGTLPQAIDYHQWLPALAATHYRDWATEYPDSERIKDKEFSTDFAPNDDLELPTAEARAHLRRLIKARRVFSNMSDADQVNISLLANSLQQGEHPDIDENSSLKAYLGALGSIGDQSDTPLPSWVIESVADPVFDGAWKDIAVLEENLKKADPPEEKPLLSPQGWKILISMLILAASSYFIYENWLRPKTTKEVFEANFDAPRSIIEDLAKHPVVSPDDSIQIERPEYCNNALEEADAFYQKSEWRKVARVLFEVAATSEYPSCQTEAFYYLGIVALKTNNPMLTLECFSKVDDLERFGEDLYWFQALAYMRIAINDATEKDNAIAAVERARSNTEIPERRAQCEKMLRQLNP